MLASPATQPHPPRGTAPPAEWPDFRSPQFLRSHALQTMAFYDGRCVDPSGGFFQAFRDDGSVFDAATRHLIGSARFVALHARMAAAFPEHERAEAWRGAARHGLRFLDQVHRDPATGGYDWLLQWRDGHKTVLDADTRCQGLAYVLHAQALALAAGLTERQALDDTRALMERFWEPEHGLYADEAMPDWQLTPYRGQKTNMYACEALLTAWQATGDEAALARAAEVAGAVTDGLAAAHRGLIWEHHHADWTPDHDYRARDTRNLSRPRGYQTGHHLQWAKLLLTLERLQPDHPDNEHRVHRARELFACAVDHGWDRAHEGMAYSFMADEHGDRRFVLYDGDKYFWVQAEAIAAAALLAERTIAGGYWDWYDRVWSYAWRHFADHRHGGWYRILAPDNRHLSDEKSPAGKCDYPVIDACLEAAASMLRV